MSFNLKNSYIILKIYYLILVITANVQVDNIIISLEESIKFNQLWLDLTKAVFDAHNNQTHALQFHHALLDNYICQLANSPCMYWWLKFSSCGLFVGPIRRPRVLGWSLNGSAWWDLKGSHLAGNHPAETG